MTNEEKKYQEWKEKWFEELKYVYKEVLNLPFRWELNGDYIVDQYGCGYDLRKVYSGESQVIL